MYEEPNGETMSKSIINKSILIRTVKTAVAAFLAIVVSQEFSLDFAAAAGIIAILNIFETRKSTIEGGLKRALSAVIALIIGGLLFEYFGYNTWVLWWLYSSKSSRFGVITTKSKFSFTNFAIMTSASSVEPQTI